MADAADSKSAGRKAVWVRLPPPAPAFDQRDRSHSALFQLRYFAIRASYLL